MSHFLAGLATTPFKLSESQYGVFVSVDLENKTLTLLTDVGSTIRLGVEEDLTWLPEDWSILGPEGQHVHAVGQFAITMNTHDPHHVVVDIVV